MIDEVMAQWKVEGKGTRRNWWDILAGNSKGKPYRQAGRQFPILRAAQIRKGLPVTSNALCRNENEVPPPISPSGRWPRDRVIR